VEGPPQAHGGEHADLGAEDFVALTPEEKLLRIRVTTRMQGSPAEQLTVSLVASCETHRVVGLYVFVTVESE
jgi:hypothetical protein